MLYVGIVISYIVAMAIRLFDLVEQQEVGPQKQFLSEGCNQTSKVNTVSRCNLYVNTGVIRARVYQQISSSRLHLQPCGCSL